MGVTLTLISHGATSATRRSAVPEDEPIEAGAEQEAAALGRSLRRVDAALTAPARAARETALAMGLEAIETVALRDLDLGGWAGRSWEEIGAADPLGAVRWTSDPSAAPHGGETVEALIRRTHAFLRTLGPEERKVVAVTHAAVLRAAALVAMQAPAVSFWRIDVAPLCRLQLRGSADRWTLRALTP